MPSTCSNGIQGCRRRFGSVQDSGCMTTIARGMSQGTLVWFKSFFHIQNVVVFTLSYKLKTSRIKIFNLFLMLDWWSFSLIPSVSEYLLPRQFFKINLQFQPMYCNFWVLFSYLSNPCSCCWLHPDKGCNGLSWLSQLHRYQNNKNHLWSIIIPIILTISIPHLGLRLLLIMSLLNSPLVRGTEKWPAEAVRPTTFSQSSS